MGQDEIFSTQSGVTREGLNYTQIRGMRMPLPPQDEQQEIVRQVEALFKQADEIEKQVATATQSAERITQSILAKAFRGELVPQDPNDEPASVLLERIKAERGKQKKVAKKAKA
jgi:type I restriction enzyme S subunit